MEIYFAERHKENEKHEKRQNGVAAGEKKVAALSNTGTKAKIRYINVPKTIATGSVQSFINFIIDIIRNALSRNISIAKVVLFFGVSKRKASSCGNISSVKRIYKQRR